MDKFIQTITAAICGIVGFLYGKTDGTYQRTINAINYK